MSPAYDEGYKAFLDGLPLIANPYCWCNMKSSKWREGWCDAEREAKAEKDRK